MTLTNGFGGSSDWLALAAAGASNGSYLNWTYVGAAVTNRTWTVTMPSTAGQYKFRLFRDNGFVRGATSPVVTVDPSFNPVPVASSLSPSRTTAGASAFVLSITGSQFNTASIVRWNGANRPTTFVSSTQLQASIGAADIATVGTAQVTAFNPSPGGGTSAPLTFTISGPPSISVSATNVFTGANVTAMLTDGPGGSGDWLALASASAPNTSYIQYIFVGGPNRTWTVAMPATPGTYEFRLFLNGGFTRAATSPAVTVVPGPNPAPVLTSTTPSSMIVGAGAFSLTVNGSGFVSSSVVRWNGADRATTFLSSSQLRAAIPAADVAAAGTAQVTVFSPTPGGGLSSPVPFSIGASTASLQVSATTVVAGASVTVTLTNGYGGGSDWLALASTSAPNNSYLQYTYVGGGVTTRTWTVTMPSTPGTYEFRLFLNNDVLRAATSPTITVTPNPNPPQLSVSATTATPGASVTVTLTNGTGGSADWLALASASAPDTSYLQYVYVGAGVTTRTWTVTMPTTPGMYQFRLFLNNSSVRAATSPVVTVSGTNPNPPLLSVSTSTAAPGAPVTVTLTNGLGGSADWLGLSLSSSPDTSYLQYVYVGAGVTTRTWTVNMPTTPGTYEFRLFPNNSFTKIATSPPVTVGSQ